MAVAGVSSLGWGHRADGECDADGFVWVRGKAEVRGMAEVGGGLGLLARAGVGLRRAQLAVRGGTQRPRGLARARPNPSPRSSGVMERDDAKPRPVAAAQAEFMERMTRRHALVRMIPLALIS